MERGRKRVNYGVVRKDKEGRGSVENQRLNTENFSRFCTGERGQADEPREKLNGRVMVP